MTALCCDVRRVVRQVLRIYFHDFGTGSDFKGGGIGLTCVYFFDGVRDLGKVASAEFTPRPSWEPPINNALFLGLGFREGHVRD
jgi:hypothetical protein